jgi:hypothetical protein
LELRQSVRRVSAVPFLVVALVCALAIGLAGINVTGAPSVPTSGTTPWFAHSADNVPGPDSPSRNRPPTPNPWDNLGQ